MLRRLSLVIAGLGLFPVTLLSAPGLWVDLELYGALAGRYEEYPGPQRAVAGTEAKVWGALPILYGAARVEGRLWKGWLLGAGGRLGSIGESRMHLKEKMGSSFVDIDLNINGRAQAWQVDSHWRVLEGGPSGRSLLDLGFGWEAAFAEKLFHDAEAGGVVKFPGQFGRFIIDYGGPFMSLRGAWEAAPGWSLKGGVAASLWQSDRTKVYGDHLSKPIDDNASGRRYALDGGLAWAPGAGDWELSGGYRHEDVYFEPTAASYSLEIWYSGPWLRAAWRH